MKRWTMLRTGLLCVAIAPAVRAMWCSPPPHLSLRRGGQIGFIGVATADTVEAGVGAVQLRDTHDRPIRSAGLRVFGQVVRIERLGASGPAAIRKQLAAGSGAVVLVPWASNSLCGVTRWRGSARTIVPGSRAAFFLSPRERKHWLRGRPTFDLLETGSNIYRSTGQWRPGTDSVLTIDEALTYADALPDPIPIAPSDTTFPELEPLRRWMRAHPDLARREPARSDIPIVMLEAEWNRVRRLESPFAGTYRFRVVFGGVDSMTIFARTQPHPEQALFKGEDRVTSPHADSPIARSEGYYIRSVLAKRLAILPVGDDYYDEKVVAGGGFAVEERPVLTNADSTVWRGSFDVLRARLASDLARQRRVLAVQAAVEKLARTDGVNPTGRFLQYRDGRVRFQSDETLDGKPLLSIRGERISAKTLIDR